jgi:hypothetical protein
MWLFDDGTSSLDRRKILCPKLSIFPSGFGHQNEAGIFTGNSGDHNNRCVVVDYDQHANSCRQHYFRRRLHFIAAVFVSLWKLQNVYHREIETSRWKNWVVHSNICEKQWQEVQWSNPKSQKYFHLFFGRWLFFRLLLSTNCICYFALHIRNAVIRNTLLTVIPILGKHICFYKLHFEHNNIFLEKLDSSP